MRKGMGSPPKGEWGEWERSGGMGYEEKKEVLCQENYMEREGGKEEGRGCGGLETSLSATLFSQRIARPFLFLFLHRNQNRNMLPHFSLPPSSEKTVFSNLGTGKKKGTDCFRSSFFVSRNRVFLGGRSFCGANIGPCHFLRSHSFYIALDTCEELWAGLRCGGSAAQQDRAK